MNVVLRIITSFLGAIIAGAISVGIISWVCDSLVPFIQELMSEYETEQDKLKKEVLDNIIDDEILR